MLSGTNRKEIAQWRVSNLFEPAAKRLNQRSGRNTHLVVIVPPRFDWADQYGAFQEVKKAIGQGLIYKSKGMKVKFFVPGTRAVSGFGTQTKDPTLLHLEDAKWAEEMIKASGFDSSEIIRTNNRDRALLPTSQSVANHVRRIFDTNKNISGITVTGPEAYAARTLIEYENAGLLPQFLWNNDLARPNFHSYENEIALWAPRAFVAPFRNLRNSLPSEADFKLADQIKVARSKTLDFFKQRGDDIAFVIPPSSSQAESEAHARTASALGGTRSAKSKAFFIVVDDSLAQNKRDEMIDNSRQIVLLKSQGNGVEAETEAISNYLKANSNIGRLITVSSHSGVSRRVMAHLKSGVPSEYFVARFDPTKVSVKASMDVSESLDVASDLSKSDLSQSQNQNRGQSQTLSLQTPSLAPVTATT